MENLVEYYEKFTEEQKNIILFAWENEYNQKHSVGLIPFLDRDKVVVALVKYAYSWRFDEANKVLGIMGWTLISLRREPHQEVVMPNGMRRMVAGKEYAVVEWYSGGETCTQEIWLNL